MNMKSQLFSVNNTYIYSYCEFSLKLAFHFLYKGLGSDLLNLLWSQSFYIVKVQYKESNLIEKINKHLLDYYGIKQKGFNLTLVQFLRFILNSCKGKYKLLNSLCYITSVMSAISVKNGYTCRVKKVAKMQVLMSFCGELSNSSFLIDILCKDNKPK